MTPDSNFIKRKKDNYSGWWMLVEEAIHIKHVSTLSYRYCLMDYKKTAGAVAP